MKSLTAILIILLPYSMFACSCFEDWITIDHIFKTDLFFKGKVIDKKITDERAFFGVYKYTFEIDEVIKGDYNKRTIIVQSEKMDCGTNYSVGAELYIFTNEQENMYHTGFCSLNKRADKKDDFLEKLIQQYKFENQIVWHNRFKDITAEGEVCNGQPIGFWIFYNEFRQLKRAGSYKNGLKEGEWKYYKHDKIRDYPDKIYKTEFYDKGIKIRTIKH